MALMSSWEKRALGLGLLLLILSSAAPGQDTPDEKPRSTAAAIRQYREAVALQNREVYDLAADEWTRFLENFGKDPLAGKARHYLGVCQLQLKQLDEAVASFSKAISDYPVSEITEQSYLNLGIARFNIAQAGKSEAYDQAAETFAKLVSQYPQGTLVPQALYYHAESLYARGKKAEAVPFYSQLIEKYPESPLLPDTLYALGVTLEELSKPAEAGATYDRFLKDFPAHALKPEVLMRRAETLFAQKQFTDAEKWFALSAATPDFKLADYAIVRQAASQYEQKKYAEAAALYATVVQKYPQSQYLATATMAAGNCCYLAGNLPEAQKWLQQVVAAGGEAAMEAGHWLAKAYLKEQKPAEALAVVDKLLPQVGRSAFAVHLQMDRADALYDMPDKRREATELYAAVAKDHPQCVLAAQALYMAGFSALGQGQSQAALDYADEFLKSRSADPLAPDVMFVAAEASLQLTRYADAEKLVLQLIEKYPNHADVETWKIRLGLAQFMQQKFAETVSALTPLLATLQSPDAVAEAQYLIGSAQLEQKQFDAAVQSLAAALAAAPKWRQADETMLNLASAYRQSGKLAEAKVTAAKVIAEFPDSKLLDRAHYRLGDIAYSQNDFATAAGEYQHVIEKWPDSALAPNALYSLGWTHIGQANYPAAIQSMTRLIEQQPGNSLVPRARYARAIARQQTKEFSGAAEDVAAFLSSKPSAAEKADAMYVLGLCEAGQQKYGEAARIFNEILKDNPQYASLDKVIYELGWALKSDNKEAEAVALFGRLATEKPDSPLVPESLYHVGESQYAAKDYANAAASYFAAMNKATKAGAQGDDLLEKTVHKLAWAYYQQGEYEKAGQSFDYQLQTFRDGALSADGLFMSAESLFKQNKFETALTAYQKSLARLPANKDFQALVYLHAGQSAAQLKKWAESLKLLEQGVQQFPDSPYQPELMYEQAWAWQNLGTTDEAFKLYAQVTAATEREVAARARFMMGEIQFEKKDYKEAVRSFFKVAYGYGYPQSPDPIKKWQASSAYEAARCFEMLAGQDASRKAPMLEQARKSYQEVIEKYPTSDQAGLAKSRLEALGI